MQLRCMYCQTMFAIGRDEMLVALQNMSVEKKQHYDAYCPRCRRANRVPRLRLEWANPGWQQAVKELVRQATQAEKEQPTSPQVEQTGASIKPAATRKGEPSKARTVAEARSKSEPKKPGKSKKTQPATAQNQTKAKTKPASKKPAKSGKGQPTTAKKPAKQTPSPAVRKTSTTKKTSATAMKPATKKTTSKTTQAKTSTVKQSAGKKPSTSNKPAAKVKKPTSTKKPTSGAKKK